MVKDYRIKANVKDPELRLTLSTEILKDLALRAEENGRSIEIEIALRLARSLERDEQMFTEDNELAIKALARIEAFLK